MVNVLVTVGLYSNYADIQNNAIRMELPQIPSIGDMIIPNSALLAKIEEMKRLWKTDVSINYVRTIGYYGSTVVVMLGGSPSLITIDFHYRNNVCGAYLSAVPRVGDLVYVRNFDEKDYLYVESVAYSADSSIVDVFLSKSKESPSVVVQNAVDVYVTNQMDQTPDGTIDVRIVDQLGTLDVRTRREIYD